MLRTAFSLALLLLTAPAAAQSPPRLELEPVVGGLERPLFVTHAGEGRDRLFVVEQPGRIRIVKAGRLKPEPFLDITERVLSGGERGLLGLAFHPDFEENRRFFVAYTRQPDGALIVSRFKARRDRAQMAEDETVLLTIDQPFANHNGGMLAFGPDRFLYIGTGDGGSGGDPGNRAQNPDSLLGKILRIDIDAERYEIPASNPFADGGGAEEIFALGFRNPWRFSFDRRRGRLWAGDVGQRRREEADIVRVGRNYGWRLKEGSRCFEPEQGCEAGVDLVDPVVEYAHENGRCSITGGYVYRGSAIPTLRGTYLYGDFCTGEIFGRRAGEDSVLLDAGIRLASFGEDRRGEVYVVDLDGEVARLVAASD